MQRRKSQRHAHAANTRWRAAEQRAQAERDAGIPDRPMYTEWRRPIEIDLTGAGGRRLFLQPRPGFVSWHLLDFDTGDVIARAALKTLLHRIADELPRTTGMRAAST